MGKPLGLTMGLQVVRPTEVQHKIWEAVAQAIVEGMPADEFKREAAEAWKHELKENAALAVQQLTR